MAKRHTIRSGDLESIFGRLQELVLANSGEDEFEEIFKIIIAKLFSEMQPNEEYSFQVQSSPTKTAQRVNLLLARANDRWRGILQGPPMSHLTGEHLMVCVEALQDYRLLDAHLEVLDAAFEYLMSRTAKGAKGQYFTPRYVIDCCIQMLDPLPAEIVLDPACGSAGFLIHILNYLRLRYPSLDSVQYCQNQLWGCDFDHRAIRIAKALMLIAGGGPSNLYRLNSLLTPLANNSLFDSNPGDDSTPRLTIEDIARSRLRSFKGFDLIVTNPPFAGEVRETHILETYQLYRKGRRIERDILFLERCLQLLKPGGRFAIVLPHDTLGSSPLTYVREWLTQHIRIIAVLGLGRNTFLPHTHQKTSILFGVKREHPVRKLPQEEILFLISEKDGKDSKGRLISRPNAQPEEPAWNRADHDLGELVTEFCKFLRSQPIRWGGYDGTACN
jgi:type I restriction enzyme M protein